MGVVLTSRKINGVPEYAYYIADNDEIEFYFVKISDLPKWEQKPFSEWLYGQTLPYIEEIPDAVFSWDYETWKRHGGRIIVD